MSGPRRDGDQAEDRMLVQLTAADLRALVRAEVEHVLHSHKPTASASRWANVSDAARHFKCTGQTIRNWIRLGAPARQVGASRHPQYRIELVEFEAWVRTQE